MKNELILGDALTVLPTLPANSFDALITDPPYASGGTHAASRSCMPTLWATNAISGPTSHGCACG